MNIKKIEIKKYLVLLGLIILSILLVIKISKFLIFLGLVLISGLIVFGNYYIKLPFDISPVFFLSIIITSTYGFHYTVFFVILAGFIPAVVSKGLDFNCFMYLGVNLLVNLISLYFPGLSIVYKGIIFSIVYSAITGVMGGIIEGEFEKEIFSMILTILINVFYFLKIAMPLMLILV